MTGQQVAMNAEACNGTTGTTRALKHYSIVWQSFTQATLTISAKIVYKVEHEKPRGFERIPAATTKPRGYGIAREMGFPKAEVYPKADRARRPNGYLKKILVSHKHTYINNNDNNDNHITIHQD